MEPAKIPLERIAEGLTLDRHTCDKELFAFVNRTLNLYGLKATEITAEPDFVHFGVGRIEDGTYPARRAATSVNSR